MGVHAAYCGTCDFVMFLRDQYGSGEHADRLVYMNEGKDAHDRLLKHEGYIMKRSATLQEALTVKKVKDKPTID